MNIHIPLALGLAAAVTLAGCSRPAPVGDATPASADTKGSVDEGGGSSDKAAAALPSAPLPERRSPIVATAFEPAIIGNVYATDFEDLIIDRWDDAGAAGRYARGAGQFEGVREKGNEGPDGIDTIRGYWVQPTSERRCDTARDGSHHWGQIQFNFIKSRQSFIGFWSFCDATPMDRWNGGFIRRDPATAAEVEAQLRALSAPSGQVSPPASEASE